VQANIDVWTTAEAAGAGSTMPPRPPSSRTAAAPAGSSEAGGSLAPLPSENPFKKVYAQQHGGSRKPQRLGWRHPAKPAAEPKESIF